MERNIDAYAQGREYYQANYDGKSLEPDFDFMADDRVAYGEDSCMLYHNNIPTIIKWHKQPSNELAIMLIDASDTQAQRFIQDYEDMVKGASDEEFELVPILKAYQDNIHTISMIIKTFWFDKN